MIGCAVFPSVVLIFFGVLLLLENVGVSDNLVGRFWPVILIILGAGGLFNMNRMRIRFNQVRSRFKDRFGGDWPPN